MPHPPTLSPKSEKVSFQTTGWRLLYKPKSGYLKFEGEIRNIQYFQKGELNSISSCVVF